MCFNFCFFAQILRLARYCSGHTAQQEEINLARQAEARQKTPIHYLLTTDNLSGCRIFEPTSTSAICVGKAGLLIAVLSLTSWKTFSVQARNAQSGRCS
jgi:hypothetical protein